MKTLLDILEIQKMLPHRYPFLLVDRIIECDEKSHIVGIKNVTINEPFFQGHFPGRPVMPGVLQIEAMAQLAGVLANRIHKSDGKIFYFSAIDGARFRRMVIPGDTLRMEIKVLRERARIVKVKGTATVDGETACEAEMMFVDSEG
jgi:beta-hydroxyacyl-ACP dehydratase FabZ